MTVLEPRQLSPSRPRSTVPRPGLGTVAGPRGHRPARALAAYAAGLSLGFLATGAASAPGGVAALDGQVLLALAAAAVAVLAAAAGRPRTGASRR